MSVPLTHYLLLSAVLFVVGGAGLLLRRNLIIVLMSIELMLNAVNIAFVAAARNLGQVDGHVFVFFGLTVAAAEVAIGLALVVAIWTMLGRTDVDEVSMMHG